MRDLWRTGSPLVLLGLALALLPASSAAEPDAEPLAFEKVVHDFGDVGQNEELIATFRYTNASDAAIERIRAVTDCGCYGLALTAATLEPGESGTLTVRFRTLNASGRQTKHPTVVYEAEGRRTRKLTLDMRVRAGVVLEPGRMHFGEVLAGTRPTGSILAIYYEGVGDPFEIKAIETPKGDFERVKPTRWHDESDPRWKGWRVPFAFRRPLEKGTYSRFATIVTDSKIHPRIRVPLTATVVGKVWVRQSRIYLGMVPKGTARRTHTIVRAFDSSIDLGSIEARAKSGRVEVGVEPLPGRPGHYRLEVKVPETAAAGPIDDIVEILTEVPGERVTELPVKGRVFERTP